MSRYLIKCDVIDMGTGKVIESFSTFDFDIKKICDVICWNIVYKGKGWAKLKRDYRDLLYRRVIFSFHSSMPGPLLIPKVTFNGTTIEDGEYVKPDMYSIIAEHDGYERYMETIEVKSIDKVFFLEVELKAKKRVIQLQLKDSSNYGNITPDIFRLGGVDIVSGASTVLGLGNYYLYISKEGYQSIEKIIFIPPGESSFIIEEILVPMK